MKRLCTLFCASRFSIVALALAPQGVINALAADPAIGGTLQKIQQDHLVTIGYRDASIPFSYYDARQNPIGYSIDFAHLIVAGIESRLKLPDLKVRMIPITSQNRMSLIQNGTIDFECTSTTNNADRARQVSFSNTFFEIGTRLLVRKAAGIRDYSDLGDKNVVVVAGTTSEKILRRMNAEKSMGMRIISAKDHSEAFLMLSTGRAKAMMMDDALLAGERAKAPDPGEYEIVGTPQSSESYGCTLRKNDAPMKAVMDQAISDAQHTGRAAAIYRRWFLQPIPPRGLDLDFPMSARMQALFAHPTDKPAS